MQRLAILGASTRAAAFSAQRAGFEPVTADLFADSDLKRLCAATRIESYPNGLVDWLGQTSADAWMYTGALENYPRLLDALAQQRRLLGISGTIVDLLRCPLRLQKLLADVGLRVPETHLAPGPAKADGSWLLKTARGSSGSGVSIYDRDLGHVPQTGQARQYVQRRVEGTPCAALYVAKHGSAELLGITRQLIGLREARARNFQYAGSVGPAELPPAALREVELAGTVIAGRFRLVGLWGIDFVLCDDQAWFLEINPRYTASVEIVERITGCLTLSAHVAACQTGALIDALPLARAPGEGPCDQRSDPEPNLELPPSYHPPRHTGFAAKGIDSGSASPAPSYAGKAILFARQDVRVPRSLTDWAGERNEEPLWPEMADLPEAQSIIGAGRPVLTVFAHSDRSLALDALLLERLAEVEERLYV